MISLSHLAINCQINPSCLLIRCTKVGRRRVIQLLHRTQPIRKKKEIDRDMEEIILVCGKWKFDKKRWDFTVDPKRGCRVVDANLITSFDDFLEMVYEEFGLVRSGIEVKLSYILSRKARANIPEDTPPVFVASMRQFEGYVRQCKVDSVRLCVEVFEEETKERSVDKEKFVVDKKPRKRDYNAKEKSDRSKKEMMEDGPGNGESVAKKQRGGVEKDSGPSVIPERDMNYEDYYARKKGEKRPIEEVGNEEDEDEKYRFDYCDDPDGASSGDDDYRLYSHFSQEEEVGDEEDDKREDPLSEVHYEDVGKKFKNEVKEEEVLLRPNKSQFRFNLRSSKKAICVSDHELAVGQIYESKDVLEDRLKVLSVVNKFDYNVEESRPNLYVVKCWVPSCTWRVRASTIGGGTTFHIRIYVRHHTCSVTERSARARQASPEILGKLYKEFVGSLGPGVVAKHVGEALNLRYGAKLDYWKAHRTLKFARKLLLGSHESGYADLPSYLYMIRRANPGTMTRLEVDEFDRFKYVFLAFGGSIEGFKFMRKVVVVDGTFLKGEYKGTLLLATTQDGNFNIFPLAFAVVDTENDESWEWFFRQLNYVIPDDNGLAIISDRHKSIGNAIKNVYPLASRGVCTYHLHKNIILRFSGSETFRLVKKAAAAYRLAEFNVLYQQIHGLNPELYNYLERADVRTWSRVHFPGDRYNFTTSNIAESINKVLNPARKYPIVQLLDAIRSMLTRWFAARQKQAHLMNTVLTNGVEKLLEERVHKSKLLDVQEIDIHQYEVSSGSTVHVVNLTMKKCSCRRFELEKLPCIHAIAAAEKANVSRITQCHPYYRKDYLCNGYAKSIMPKDSTTPVPESYSSFVCNPPFVRNPPGRPKLSRMKGQLEVAMENRRPRKVHACSKCNGIGHNRTTCHS